MTSTYSIYIGDDSGVEFDYDLETVGFTCPICQEKQSHKVTVQFLLGQDEIRCKCTGTMIANYAPIRLTVTNFD